MSPDIILLEIGLPKINGLEAARRIRAQSQERHRMTVGGQPHWPGHVSHESDIGTRPGLVRAAGELQRILWTYRAASTSRSASSQSSSSSPGVKPRRSAIQYAAVAIRDSRSSAVRGCLVSSSRSMALPVVAGRCGNAVPLEAGPDEVTAPEFLESAIVFSCVQAMDAAAPDGCGSES
jgi:hypothetical protein